MRRKLKKLTSVCLAVIMIASVLTVAPFTAGAVTTDSDSVSVKSGDFKYTVFDDEWQDEKIAMITDYTGSATDLVIPSEIDGYAIIGIGWSTFENNTNLVSVVIPDGVIFIGAFAFSNCTSLKSITIPDSVTEIDEYAFESCTSLVSVVIPDSVVDIGEYAFYGCESLTDVTISNNVDEIGWGAFVECHNLKSVTIPCGVGYIGDYAFGYIINEYGTHYKPMDGFTIYGYTNSLAGLYAYENGFNFVSRGEVSPFTYEVLDDETVVITRYTGIESELVIPSEIDGYAVTGIDVDAFANNTNLVSVVIPDGVIDIGGGAFEGCENLINVSIPKSVESINWCAFRNCPKLTSVTIPYDVIYIREQAFGYIWDEDEWEYKAIEGFTIYGYTNSLAELYAYENGFTFVSIGEVSPFRYKVFDDETTIITRYTGNEAEVVIPSKIDGNAVTGISWNAFENNTKLVSVTIPDGVTYIGAYAFSNCINLNHITISGSVKEIDWGAFANCPKLTSVTIPGDVIHIYEHAFGYILDEDEWEYEPIDGFTIYGYTNSLAEIYADENGFTFISIGEVSPFRYEAFDDETAVIKRYTGKETELVIPSEFDGYTVTEIGENAFENNTKLVSVTIPDSVTYIGWSAFANCPNLKSITIPDSVEYIGEYAFGYILDEYEWEYKPIDGFTIYGYTGSLAEEYAFENGFAFISLGDAPTPSLGDVNGDGKISIDDVTDIQKYLANMLAFTENQEALADVDMDGKVSIDDVTLIQKYLAGMATI